MPGWAGAPVTWPIGRQLAGGGAAAAAALRGQPAPAPPHLRAPVTARPRGHAHRRGHAHCETTPTAAATPAPISPWTTPSAEATPTLDQTHPGVAQDTPPGTRPPKPPPPAPLHPLGAASGSSPALFTGTRPSESHTPCNPPPNKEDPPPTPAAQWSQWRGGWGLEEATPTWGCGQSRGKEGRGQGRFIWGRGQNHLEKGGVEREGLHGRCGHMMSHDITAPGGGEGAWLSPTDV